MEGGPASKTTGETPMSQVLQTGKQARDHILVRMISYTVRTICHRNTVDIEICTLDYTVHTDDLYPSMNKSHHVV